MWKIETVHPWENALLYVNGVFKRQLPNGRHRILSFGSEINVFRLPSYPFHVPIAPADVISADRFALRLGATVVARLTDPRAAVENQLQYTTTLSLAVTEALVALAGERTLDALITDRPKLGELLLARVKESIAEFAIDAATVSALVLPPEVRRMLTDVERAKVEGQATLERARGEHAALRSLANAARLLKDNPELMRLRTLQAVSPTGKGATLVLGQDALSAPNLVG